MFTNIKAAKRFDEKNRFDQHNDNLRDQKQYVTEQAAAPKVEPAAPRMRNGKVEHPSVTLARQNMEAAKRNAQAETAHHSRFQAVAQDTETVGALVSQWISQTPGFVATPFNKESLSNAVNEWVLKGHAVSIAALNDIFDELVEGNYLNMSGHLKVRGQGIMTGRPTIYPVYETAQEQRQEIAVRKRAENTQTVSGDRELSLSELRKLSDSELAARARAGYKPDRQNRRVI